MNASRWLPALAVLLCVAAPADAQFVSPHGGRPGFYAYGGGFNYSRVRGRGSLSLGVGFVRGGYFCPPLFAGPPFGITSSRVTIVTIAPPPPLFFFPPPGSFLGDLPPDLWPRQRQLDQLPVPDLPPAPPIPQVPMDEKPKPKPPEKKEEEKPKEAPRPRPKPKPPEPEDEYSRQMKMGRELFAEAQYGRAAARFRQAAALEPKEPLPSFLLVQALLEQGKYDDARDAILEGLRRKPDWPATGKFRPLDYYEQNQEEYTELLLTLERVQSKLPNDPVLLLLRGYALWFDGQKAQAAVLLRRALNGPDRAAVERFLAALPDEEL